MDPMRQGAFDQGLLECGRHRVAWWRWGNPAGRPVLVLHGGPGAGSHPRDREPFSPSRWQVIQMDQRGCGSSQPRGETRENRTEQLIEDIELLRATLRIENWTIAGGSWGSTLALVYAQGYPRRTRALLLRGVFLCRQQDIDWLYEAGGAGRFRPEAFHAYQQFSGGRDGLLQRYGRLIQGPEGEQAASHLAGWEESLLRMKDADTGAGVRDPVLGLLEQHYLSRRGFLQENQILERMGVLAEIPGAIVHGRYDLVCPPDQAWELHRAWPRSQLEIVLGGHAPDEPALAQALRGAALRLWHTT